FNLTALLDWSGAQTSPIESFAHPPVMIVPETSKARNRPLTEAEMSRRKMFFEIFRACEIRSVGSETPISRTQESMRSMIAGVLDAEAILGHDISQYMPDLVSFVFEADVGVERSLE